MWKKLIQLYWRVSLFKESPANTPFSYFLLGLISLWFFIVLLLQWKVTDLHQQVSLEQILLTGLGLLASYYLYSYLLLYFCKKQSRFVQAVSCLLAGHSIVHVFALALAPFVMVKPGNLPLGMIVFILYFLATLALTVWQFMISTYIFREALKIEVLPAVLASFGLVAANILSFLLGVTK